MTRKPENRFRPRVKFCGITSVADAQAAMEAGCDAIGLVFVSRSPRCVTPQQALRICEAVSPWVNVVGLFADCPAERVRQVMDAVPLHALQFHGAETAAFCGRWQKPWIKAVPMLENSDAIAYAGSYPQASGWLLDCYGQKQTGGSGKSFDWSLFPADNDPRWILAGGLDPNNVREAVRATGARNLDVSSGIESSPGIKCPHKMHQFMQQIRSL